MKDVVIEGVKMEEEKREPEISQGMLELTKNIINLQERHLRLKKEAAELWHEKERLEANLIEQMETLDLKNFRHKELGLISVGRKIWGRIADVEKAREYFESQGIADQLLELRIRAYGGQKRLNEIIRECIENGKIIPVGLDYSSKAVIRRS